MLIKKKRGWEIPESAATPESMFWNRREALKGLGAIGGAVAAGAVVLPAMPGWYHGVESVLDLVDFIVARILDQLEIENQLMQRWGKRQKYDETITTSSGDDQV